MKLAIFGQNQPSLSKNIYLSELLNELIKYNSSIFIEKEFLKSNIKTVEDFNYEFKTFTSFNDLDKDFDFFISLGGDGTILRSVQFIKNLGIPILGINTGRLGFLATVPKEDIKTTIEDLISKKYSLEERSLLYFENEDDPNFKTGFALNEVSITRQNTASLICVEIYLDDVFFSSYWSDGIIIATPTGSTGYSLSCGGPILTPDTENFVITPIAPHNLNSRPLVISDSRQVKMIVKGREDKHLLSNDTEIRKLDKNSIITVKRAPFKISTIRLKNSSFQKTLRQKLLWSEDLRNHQ